MIPLLDLEAQYRAVQEPLERAVLDVMRSGAYVLGPPVAAFERDFADYCGVAHAVSVNTGTSALHLGLIAAGIRPGDEVVTVGMTFVATVAAILYAGATPVIVDVDPHTYTMDPAAFEAAITPRTRAVVPVHLHGRLADMAAIGAIADRHGIMVIEDAAQAHGAEQHGRRAGGFGTVGCFSFYPGKNLGACGEGGAVVTDDPRIAEEIRSLRDWGQEGRYNHVRAGFNYRLDTVQAAALGVKLPFLAGWTLARRRAAARYDALLAQAGLRAPKPGGREHVYHVYAVRVPDRDAVRARMLEDGVATGIHYPRPVHHQPAYADKVVLGGPCPVAEALAGEWLSLPLFPEITDTQIATVVASLTRSLGDRYAEAV
ncbi:UDP-2-acetamido-2-deoxy-3-oxo-D-glucuronate aminotransferase [Methylobacterium crusticola]|uniref:UDP-2-acetamido-2-deoxy-3-oxo-D-glucuronate aminotransferase n=1 Tax=Methylobacterium crusticola TaxID=1697972 RepID=A0ABQ4QZI8_9HYPH|nr:DegT/DnrJ/EryC1/StrS family aminotransferase [Methylobacterium crusticola]GJD50828.1 UDP-2-acetamido-2-deoxy-3-oxo-D-glucuronate aminotransferase [Methylobacterium crusticola]